MPNRFGAAAVLAAVVLLGACNQGTNDAPRAETEITTDRARPRAALEHLTLFPKGDLRRVDVLYATPGSDVLVLGGQEIDDRAPIDEGESGVRPAPDGWLHRGDTGRWSKVELPFAAPLAYPGVVSAGDRAIVVGTPCDENFPSESGEPFCSDASTAAAVYSASTGEWSEAARPGGELRNPRSVHQPYLVDGVGWTGTHAVFRFLAMIGDVQYALYDPEDDRWSSLPDVDGGDPRDVCVAGDEVVAIGLPRVQPEAVAGPGLFQAVPGPIRTARFTSAGTWEHLPDQELATGANPTATGLLGCQGGEAFVSRWAEPGELNSLQWFDPSATTWTTLPPPPEPFRNATPARVGSTRVLYPTTDSYWLLDDGATEWRPVPKPTRTCPGFPETCEVSPPQVQSTDRGLLLIDMNADGNQPIGIMRLRPLQFEAVRAAGP
jgi:hypothetical protein